MPLHVFSIQHLIQNIKFLHQVIALVRDCLPYIRIREEDVKKLKKLVVNKGYGPDVNPPTVRKHRTGAIGTHIHQFIYFRRYLS